MFSKLLARYYKKFSTNKYILRFSRTLNAKHLWDFERDTMAKALGVGFGCAWIPLPFHTTIAIILALIIDCNLAVVAIAIWIANPLTMPFMYYFAYRLGEVLLDMPRADIEFHLTVRNILKILHEVWEPFILGCAVCGLAFGFLAYFFVHLLWPKTRKHR